LEFSEKNITLSPIACKGERISKFFVFVIMKEFLSRTVDVQCGFFVVHNPTPSALPLSSLSHIFIAQLSLGEAYRVMCC